MANVKIKVYTVKRETFENESIEVEGETLIEAIKNFIKIYPQLREELLENDQKLKSDYVFLVNGRNVEVLEKENTKLKDGDKISIFPPITGG